jgi:hypothetical protein
MIVNEISLVIQNKVPKNKNKDKFMKVQKRNKTKKGKVHVEEDDFISKRETSLKPNID